MGKNKKLKLLRRIARSLPVIERQLIESERVSGYELEKRGEKDVVPEQYYKVRKVVTREGINVNHSRRLKKYFRQFGEPGVHGYINAVKEHVRQAETKV